MKDEAKKRIEEWRTLADELNVQFHLGSAEAKEEFEKQKKKLTKWLDAVGNKLHIAQDLSKEKAVQLKSSMEELQVQAALGTAETKEELAEQQKKITKAINTFKHNLSEAQDSTKENLEDFAEKLDVKLNDFHTRFDLFRLHLHLGKEETKEMRDETKKEIAHKLQHIKTKLVKAGEEIEEKWDDFSEDIRDQWNYLRNMN